jgi:hypothetical protein
VVLARGNGVAASPARGRSLDAMSDASLRAVHDQNPPAGAVRDPAIRRISCRVLR